MTISYLAFWLLLGTNLLILILDRTYFKKKATDIFAEAERDQRNNYTRQENKYLKEDRDKLQKENIQNEIRLENLRRELSVLKAGNLPFKTGDVVVTKDGRSPEMTITKIQNHNDIWWITCLYWREMTTVSEDFPSDALRKF